MAFIEIFKRAGQPLGVKNEVPILMVGSGHSDIPLSVEDINGLFERRKPVEKPLRQAVLAALYYLQEGAIDLQYGGDEGAYEFAQEEYPNLYFHLLHGLTDKALEGIRQEKVTPYIGTKIKGLGEEFYWRFKFDRALADYKTPDERRLEEMQVAIDALKMFDPKLYAKAHIPDTEYLAHRHRQPEIF